MEELETIRYVWCKKNGVALWSTRAVTAHKCSLKRCVAAGRKDLLLCSDLHLGMISRYLFITPPPPRARRDVGGRGVSEIALILGCILSSARVHRRVSRSDGFIHSVVVCCACLLSPTSHKKKNPATPEWRMMFSAKLRRKPARIPRISAGRLTFLMWAERST